MAEDVVVINQCIPRKVVDVVATNQDIPKQVVVVALNYVHHRYKYKK
jgi:hypothetical protein